MRRYPIKKAWFGFVVIVLAIGTVRAESVCGVSSYPSKNRTMTITDRLKDCLDKDPAHSTRESPTSDASLNLVARIKSGTKYPEFYEVWQVSHSGQPIDGLLIGDVHPGRKKSFVRM